MARKRAAAASLPCPVGGCGLRVTRPGQAPVLEPHTITVGPLDGGRTFPCVCPRHALLTAVQRRSGPGLVERRFDPDARQEHNLIAHALQRGQGHRERRRSHPVDRQVDPDSAEMVLAYQEAHRLLLASAFRLNAGRTQSALEAAAEGLAAQERYEAYQQRLTRRARRDDRSGLWHHLSTFWIEIPVQPRGRPGGPVPARPEPPLTPRFTFKFMALWNDQDSELEVANGPEIEAASGVVVGGDGWRELIRLLTRFEAKPGRETEDGSLIWRDDRGTWTLREHVRRAYPRAVLALEALRLTLRPDPGRAGRAPPEPHPDWAAGEPPWVTDAAEDRSPVPAPERGVLARLDGVLAGLDRDQG